MQAVQVQELKKFYGPPKNRVNALNGISFQVGQGELFGLIGPDGAGKTSLFRILTTLLLPDGGQASLNGLDIVRDFMEIRKRVGYMPGRFSLYQDLTVQENLEFFATIFNTTIQANYDMIRDIYVQIEPFRNRRAGKLSGGMKQKLALCCALIHRPELLFLDEPTTGVDAVSRKEFWAMLQTLRNQGLSILVSTPYMDEAALCDKVALLQKGTILSIDRPAHIVSGFGKQLYGARSADMLSLLSELESSPHVESAYASGIYHRFTLRQETALTVLQTELASRQHELEMLPVEPNIEDCFMALMH